jgi:hypothetical protein
MKRENGTVNIDAARQAVAFMRSLARRGRSPKGDKWSREALYEDRMSRVDKVEKGLGTVQGWLADDDPFFAAVDEIVGTRPEHRPRTLRKPQKPKPRKS